jgi:hypothetical protein
VQKYEKELTDRLAARGGAAAAAPHADSDDEGVMVGYFDWVLDTEDDRFGEESHDLMQRKRHSTERRCNCKNILPNRVDKYMARGYTVTTALLRKHKLVQSDDDGGGTGGSEDDEDEEEDDDS